MSKKGVKGLGFVFNLIYNKKIGKMLQKSSNWNFVNGKADLNKTNV